MYLGEWSELEHVFVPQGYPLDQLLLLLYVVGVEILQHTHEFENCGTVIQNQVGGGSFQTKLAMAGHRLKNS